MKRFTSLMLMLLCAVVTFAQTVKVTTGLPGTIINESAHAQYEWTSEKFTSEGDVNKIRVTFLENSNKSWPADYPCVTIAEFYLYDKDGNAVALAPGNFSSNATETQEGSIDKLCDGVRAGDISKYNWYWHSYWSSNQPNPLGFHYLEIDVENVEADLSEFSIGWVTRQQNGSPAEVVISAGATTEDVIKNTNSQMLPKVSTERVYVYTIRSSRSKNYLTYSEDKAKPVQNATATDNSYWYFTEGTDGKVVMHNVASGKVLGTNFEMSAEGEWHISPAVYHPGVVFSITDNIKADNCIDDQSGSIGSWSHNKGDSHGTTWLVEAKDIEVPVISLQNMKISNIGEAVTEVESDKWYILRNVNRGAIVSQESNNWKMRPIGNVVEGNSAQDKAGYLFKITKNGEYYNIMSGNSKYFKLGYNTASTSTSPVNFDIGLIGESTNNFYLFDKENKYTADGQEVNNNFVGWSTSVPATAGGNDSYMLLPVELTAASAEEVALAALITQIEGKNIKGGEYVGNYSTESVENLNTALATAKADTDVTADDIAALQAAYDALEIVLPTADKVYALDSYMDYLFNETDGSTAIKTSCAFTGLNTKAYWRFIPVVRNGETVGYKIQNVHTGLYINNAIMSETPGLFQIVTTTTEGDNAKHAAEDHVYIKIGSTDNCLHSTSTNVKAWTGGGPGNQYKFEEVDEFSHKLNVTAAGWSTLVLGFNATIPTAEGFKAYTIASVGDGYIKLAEATGVLGANTPIIVNAPAANYDFAYTTEAATVTESGLEGTLYNKNIQPDGVAYVLGYINVAGEGEEERKEVGLYKAVLNQAEGTAFLNNANKAYLVVPATEGTANVASYSFRFGEGTTGVENVVVENEVKAIYDLTGRRVENISAPGIYIVGGKKVLVK